MSFYADPVLLFLDGEGYARLPESAQGGAAKVVGGTTVGLMLAAGVATYLDQPWTKRLWKPFGAKTGTHFMLAWPFAHGKRRRRTRETGARAGPGFAAHPFPGGVRGGPGRPGRP